MIKRTFIITLAAVAVATVVARGAFAQAPTTVTKDNMVAAGAELKLKGDPAVVRPLVEAVLAVSDDGLTTPQLIVKWKAARIKAMYERDLEKRLALLSDEVWEKYVLSAVEKAVFHSARAETLAKLGRQDEARASLELTLTYSKACQYRTRAANMEWGWGNKERAFDLALESLLLSRGREFGKLSKMLDPETLTEEQRARVGQTLRQASFKMASETNPNLDKIAQMDLLASRYANR